MAANANQGEQTLTTFKRFLIAGVGALAPVLVQFASTEAHIIGRSIQELAAIVKDPFAAVGPGAPLYLCVGYVLRCVFLFLSGGFWVIAFNSQEGKVPQILQLGIVAPALLMAAAFGPSLHSPNRPVLSAGIITPGVSKTVTPNQAEKVQEERLSPLELLRRGFFGIPVERKWFVIVGSHRREEDAREQAQEIAKKFPGFNAKVYAPYRTPYYAVTIGDNLTKDQADALLERAMEAGLPSDSYVSGIP